MMRTTCRHKLAAASSSSSVLSLLSWGGRLLDAAARKGRWLCVACRPAVVECELEAGQADSC